VILAPRIVIADGGGRREVPLPEGTTTAVGRGPAGNGIRLEERNVSRRHACFHVVGGAVTVEDLGSRTGTFVNGSRVAAPQRLRPGDRVRIGDFELLLTDGGAELPAPAGATSSQGLPPPIPNRFIPSPRPAGPSPSSLRRLAKAAARAVDAVVPRKGKRRR
jgi:pSer/pThr/pTyr-binding forkhead associated (FHA) protein